MEKKLKEFLEYRPDGEEWWNSTNKEFFQEIANTLTKKEICSDDIINILNKAFWAISAEYGD